MGRRVLSDSKSDEVRARPDYLGVVLVSTALAALVLGISEGPSWGWSSGRVVACFVAAAILGAAFVYRSAHHAEPVLDLTLFSARSFSVANAATLLYAMGFFAMLLGNILFLTSVWHYSILRAGLAVTPGPLVVAVVSGPAGRLAARVGFRRVLLVRDGLLRRWARLVRHPDRAPPCVPGALAAGDADHRPRDRTHLPGAQRGGGVEPAPRAIRRGECGQPDRPSGRRRLRRGASRRHPRHSAHAGRVPSTTSGTCGGTRASMAVLSGLACSLLRPARAASVRRVHPDGIVAAGRVT